ncbi:MAG: peptide-methionine (R)-S-oxide reductase [Chlamydiales bacterium]|jgi:peptide-methionine (R)-S-oxide reductase
MNQDDQNIDKLQLSNEQWRDRLTPEHYHILREKGTETPCSGQYYQCREKGTYACFACGQHLFDSESKFNSGSGWPSFDKPITDDNVLYQEDNNHGISRVEILCARCESHLGHVFNDGPTVTGKRFCVNSASLHLEKSDE